MKESLLNILPLTDGFHYYVTYKAGNYVVQVAKYSNLDFGKVEMVSFGDNPKSDIVSYEIGFRKLEESYCGKTRAKIAIVDRKIVKNTGFTKISSRLKDCGFDSIYGGNDKEVEMLVEW